VLYTRGSGTTDWSSGVWVEPSPGGDENCWKCSLKQDVYYTQEM
jgi:hypothetical protein